MAIILSFKANTDLTEGRYALFMDERITFDGVRILLHPTSIRSLLDNVIDGGDHRYGRILWNTSALFSILPERAWGISGQIVSTRLIHSIIQLAAYWIFIFGFIKNWTLRGLGLLLLVALPYSSYFATMPKPEPIQMLFLAIFLVIAAKNIYQFGYYWLFLGLAFGAKISTITLVPLFLGLGSIGQIYQKGWVGIPIPKRLSIDITLPIQIIFTTLGSLQIVTAIHGLAKTKDNPFLVNFLVNIAWPSLTQERLSLALFIIRILFAAALILVPIIIRRLAGNKRLRATAIINSICMLAVGFSISVPVVLFKFPQGILIWLWSIFLNTSHGSDNATVNIYSWIKYILNDYLPIPAYLTILVLLTNTLCFVLVTSLLWAEASNVEGNRNSMKRVIGRSHSLVLLACSMLSVFPIVLSVNRLWGHYLHLGTVFFVVAMLACYEELFLYGFKRAPLRRLIRLFIAALITIQIPLILFNAIPAMALDMNRYASRTATKEYITKKEEYNFILNLIAKRSAGNHLPIKVYLGADLFIPDGNEQVQVREIFGYFSQWEENADLIVLYRSKSPLGNKPSINSAMYEPWLTANKAFMEHLSTNGGSCLIKPCYTEISTPYPELMVLTRID